MKETLQIDFVVERIDDLKIASTMEGKKGVGMIFTCPDGDDELRIGFSVEAVRYLRAALVEAEMPPNPVIRSN